MKTKTAQSNSNLTVATHKRRVLPELANGGMNVAIQESKYRYSVKAEHFAEVK